MRRALAVARLVLAGVRDARTQRLWFLTTEEVPSTPLTLTPEGVARLREEWAARAAGRDQVGVAGFVRPGGDGGVLVETTLVDPFSTQRITLGEFRLADRTAEDLLRRIPARRRGQATVVVEARHSGDQWEAIVRGTAPESVDGRGRYIGPRTMLISYLGRPSRTE